MKCQFCGKPVNPDKNEKEGEHDACYEEVSRWEADDTLCIFCGKTLPDGSGNRLHSECEDIDGFLNLPDTE